MRQQKEIDILLKLFLILNAIRNMCLFFSLEEFATLVFYSAHIVIALIVLLIALLKIGKPFKLNCSFLAFLILLTMLIVVPMTYDKTIWTVRSFTPVSVLFTMFFLIASKNIIISERTIRVCCITYIFQGIIAVLCTFMPGSFEYGALVLHIGNPNQTAIILWASFTFCYLYWAKKRVKKKYTLALNVLMISLVVMIVLTQSRTILLAFLICLVWHFWGNRKKGYRNYPIAVQYVLILAPIYIPIFILFLRDILPNEFTIFGKLLFSGREQIWGRIIDAFWQNPFSYHLDTSPFYSNIILDGMETLKGWGAHNGFLSIQWNYGIVVLVLVICILFIYIKELREYANNNMNSCFVYVVVLATIFSLSFEEALLMGNICTTAILPLLFIIGRSEQYNSLNTSQI